MLHKVFEDAPNVEDIIKGLSVVSGERIEPGALIFFDEIQECPLARSSLKPFTIDGRYDVIASGSLIGVNNSRLGADRPLMPMGYEEHMTMLSLDFEEFLWGKGIDVSTINDVRRCIKDKGPILPAIPSVFTDAFIDFMIVGGMPESVKSFIKTGNYSKSSDVKKEILDTCLNDINRYNKGLDIIKTSECFKCIPMQLADTNNKFIYSRVSGMKGRAAYNRYAENLLWIKEAGYGNFCYATDGPILPLAAHTDRNNFKIYLSDTGLLVQMYGKETAKAIFLKETNYNSGAIVENVVAECLMKAGYVPRYYRKTNGNNRMELDFVLEMGMGICVIEVKSGKKRGAPSIEKVSKVFNIGRRVMLENGNISVDDDGIEHYPLFVAAFMKDLEPEWDGPEF